MISRYILYALGLATAWVMLWDQVTIANAVSGVLVAVALLVAFPLQRVAPVDRRLVRPFALTRLACHVLADLVVSNLVVSREIVRRRPRLHTGIVACPMSARSPQLLSTIANVLALSPGLMAVEATRPPGDEPDGGGRGATLYVYLPLIDNVDGVRAKVSHLERLVVNAIGSSADRAALQSAT